jgi:hypothetical protein
VPPLPPPPQLQRVTTDASDKAKFFQLSIEAYQ